MTTQEKVQSPILKGRHLLLTGGSQGINQAIVEMALKAGARTTLLLAQPDEAVESLCQRLDGTGKRLRSQVCSLASDEEVTQALKEITDAMGTVDILVNHASKDRGETYVNMIRRTWNEIFDETLAGALRLTTAVLPAMEKQGWGRIVNVDATGGQTGVFGLPHLRTARGALASFTTNLALEVARQGITVNAVAPGAIDTGATQEYNELIRQQISNSTPIGRLGRPEEVAHAIIYLASPGAAYITGQIIAVDGGLTM